MRNLKHIGIFGWGVVAPKSSNIEAFEHNLDQATSWLEPHDGFGLSNFLVGRPDFDFNEYKAWITERFGSRRFSQLNQKMGNMTKYAIGAFIQALGQNPSLEKILQILETKAHIYVGTGLGDFPLQYEKALIYYKAQKRWNRFWCQNKYHPELADYRQVSSSEKHRLLEKLGAPQDPGSMDTEASDDNDMVEDWYTFWVMRSDGLKQYLKELREIESESITGDIDKEKMHVLRKKANSRRRLNEKYGCPVEPWNAVDPMLLWNIPNIPASQISMIGKITGPSYAPVAACSGFGTALKMGLDAIQHDQAKAVVIGASDPEPHPLSVGTFYGARVLSHDSQVSKPFSGLRGTHISGGACIWIIGDADYFIERGFKPLGLEILSVSLTSDADHIITPSKKGPLTAIYDAMKSAGVTPEDVTTWDMHATATPGDWTELKNTLEVFPGTARFTARKGTFGHGMSVCGGWELTAQHMGFSKGKLKPINLNENELHDKVRPYHRCLISSDSETMEGDIAGKINMGVGGINACVISRRWPMDLSAK